METALDITLQKYTWDWLLRPVSGIIAALAVLTIVLSAAGIIKQRRESPDTVTGETAATGREAELQKFTSLPFSAVMLAVFIYAIVEASGWRQEGGRIVLAFSYPGAAFCAAMVFSDLREFFKSDSGEITGSIAAQYKSVIGASKEPRAILGLFGWFIGIVAVTYVAGQMVALPLYVFLFLKFLHRKSWKIVLMYTFATWLLLWGMFGEIIHVVWQPPLLDFLPQ